MEGWQGGAEAEMGVRELEENCIGECGGAEQQSTAHLKKRSSFQSV